MKLEKKKFTRIIDLGSGNASFLRWCYFVGLNFDEMTLVDYDKKLMNDFYPKTKSFLLALISFTNTFILSTVLGQIA